MCTFNGSNACHARILGNEKRHAPILDTRSNESSTGVIVSKDPTWKNLLKKVETLFVYGKTMFVELRNHSLQHV